MPTFMAKPHNNLPGCSGHIHVSLAALLDATTRNEQRFVRSWAYWGKLEEVKEKYAMVLGKLRGAGLPDVLAGVPFRESQYFEEAKDPILCAFGMWQFQPEIAFRNGLTVKGCHNGGNPDWEPHAKALPIGALQHAEYVLNGSCTITRCDQDERGDPKRATDAAVNNFLVPWKDDDFKRSGAAVQLVIATHNAGYDDSPYRDGKESRTNIRVAYRRYLKQSGKTRAPDFIGLNLTCNKPGQIDEHDNVASSFNDSCGSYLPSVTQVYVPYVIAAHLVAVCYYGTNYGTDPDYPEFKPYQAYASGYCKEIKVPTPDDVRQHPVSK
jgi:hypothetical protein